MISDKINDESASHTISLYSSEPVLSNVFYALRLKYNLQSENALKALSVWFNSTWGILSILANRAETEGGWIRLNMTKWRLQPVLDVTKLSEETIDKLADVFDKYSNREFRRLPEQFNPENVDVVRKELDIDFLSALGINVDESEINELYRMTYENLKLWIGEKKTTSLISTSF